MKKKKKKSSNWSFLMFPGMFLAYSGAATNIKIITILGIGILIIGGIIWFFTS